jgi:hypothetical protein
VLQNEVGSCLHYLPWLQLKILRTFISIVNQYCSAACCSDSLHYTVEKSWQVLGNCGKVCPCMCETWKSQENETWSRLPSVGLSEIRHYACRKASTPSWKLASSARPHLFHRFQRLSNSALGINDSWCVAMCSIVSTSYLLLFKFPFKTSERKEIADSHCRWVRKLSHTLNIVFR